MWGKFTRVVLFSLLVLPVLFLSVDIGVVLPENVLQRWVMEAELFTKLSKDLKLDVSVLFSENSPGKERENVEALLAKGAKVIIYCPVDATAAAASAEMIKKAGATVISYDRLIMNTTAVDYYVTFDSVEVGRLIAKYLLSKVQPNSKNNNLYIYAGALADNNAFLIFQGAWEILQPKIADGTFRIVNSTEANKVINKKTLTRDEMAKIISQVTTDWNPSVAKKKAEDDLSKSKSSDKGTVYVLAPNDATARAIADVMRTDKDIKNYYITGQDADKASIQYIIDGKQSMTVFKDVRKLVSDALKVAQLVLEKKKPTISVKYNNGKKDVETYLSEIVVVTKENVKNAIIDSGYYSEKDFVWK